MRSAETTPRTFRPATGERAGATSPECVSVVDPLRVRADSFTQPGTERIAFALLVVGNGLQSPRACRFVGDEPMRIERVDLVESRQERFEATGVGRGKRRGQHQAYRRNDDGEDLHKPRRDCFRTRRVRSQRILRSSLMRPSQYAACRERSDSS